MEISPFFYGLSSMSIQQVLQLPSTASMPIQNPLAIDGLFCVGVGLTLELVGQRLAEGIFGLP